MSGSQDAGQTPGKKSRVKSVFFILAVIASGAYLFSAMSGQTRGDAVGEYAAREECVRIVAEWAGADIAQVSSSSVGTGAVALDYRGNYPGGEWACGGEKGRKDPYQVIVYPADGSVAQVIHESSAP